MKLDKTSKILYLSDNYANNVAGTKISIFNEMKKRGYNITFNSVHSSGKNLINVPQLIRSIQANGYDWVWIAHTWTKYIDGSLSDINNAGANVLGFGFSDPYDWDINKLKSYNAYATNSHETYSLLKSEEILPVTTFYTAGDTSFHQNMGLNRDIDILVYGIGKHKRFDPPKYRIQVMDQIIETFSNKNIAVCGNHWINIPSRKKIVGQRFLSLINRSRVSLDLQQLHAPLAHRMFECMFCGTPVITRDRPETMKIFKDWGGMATYNSTEDLLEKIEFILSTDKWEDTSSDVSTYSRKNHDISNRIDHLIEWLNTNV